MESHFATFAPYPADSLYKDTSGKVRPRTRARILQKRRFSCSLTLLPVPVDLLYLLRHAFIKNTIMPFRLPAAETFSPVILSRFY